MRRYLKTKKLSRSQKEELHMQIRNILRDPKTTDEKANEATEMGINYLGWLKI
jgi:hypothetical protein